MQEALGAALWGLCMLALRTMRGIGRCPRCVSMASSLWAEGYLLGLAMLTVREALQLPGELRSATLWCGWLQLPAHAAVWACAALVARHLVQLRPLRSRCPRPVDLVADVVLLPPTFGLLSLRCLRRLTEREGGGKDLWRARAAIGAAELWESWALWSFQRLFMSCEDTTADSNPFFASLAHVCSVGLQQYLVFIVASNLFEVLMRYAVHVHPETCDLFWGLETSCQEALLRLRDHASGALWFSCSVALYSLARFEAAVRAVASPGAAPASQPPRQRLPGPDRQRFRGAQLIVAMASVQRLLLVSGTMMSLWQETSAWSAHSYLLCLEACVLAVVHFWAYPEEELQEWPLAAVKAAGAVAAAPRPTAYGKLSDSTEDSATAESGAGLGARWPVQGTSPQRPPRVAVPRLPLPLPRENSEGTMPHYSGSASRSSEYTVDRLSGAPSGSSRTASPVRGSGSVASGGDSGRPADGV